MNQSNSNNLEKIRHSAEHVLMQAMQNLYGKDKFYMAMGPATAEGFYFDFEPLNDFKVSEEDFEKIETEMKKIIGSDLPVTQKFLSIGEAKNLFSDNPYKVEWLDSIQNRGEQISVYYTGDDFFDLCAGPHVSSTGEIKTFKLLSVAGAYWHGDEKNKMLTRIYGTAFESQKDLDQQLFQIEEAKKRDHRKLGQDLDLFMFDQEIGQGLVVWLPKGATLRKQVMDFALNTYLNNGYQLVSTPHIASNELWKHSGHIDFYKDSLYGEFAVEDEKYRLKPMNCPFHVYIYKNKPKSYKELPIRYTEMGTVYRYERSGTLHGLTRVRSFTQDDAHIICAPEQLSLEIENAFKLTLFILKTFGFEKFEVNLSVRDSEKKSKFIGSDDQWDTAEKALIDVISKMGFGDSYVKDVGGAVFYGPKIDIKVNDAIGRKWQLSTLQFDFNLPGRFEMEYIDKNGQRKTPYMVHRALLGSLERFIGVLIEHFVGAFPTWLSPIQVKLIPITDDQHQYTNNLALKLKKQGIRVEIDDRSEKMQAKIRDAQLEKIPYMGIIGKREVESDSVAIRQRDGQDLGAIPIEEFITKIHNQIESRDLNLLK